MPANLHDKLINLEVNPPATSWENISKRLDEEFDVAEIRLSQKLMDATAMPPDKIWEDIAAAIPARQEIKHKARVIPMKWKRIAVAAILLGLIATTIIYFVNSGIETPIVPVAINPPHTDSNKKLTEKTQDPAIVQNPLSAPTIAITPRLPDNTILSGTAQEQKSTAVAQSRISSRAEEPRNLKYSHTGYIQSIRNSSPIAINGPSIRDINGRIILDPDLVTAPGDKNYIIVTAPNGEQTRISSKFLYLLSSLNEPDQTDYKDLPSWIRAGWRKRFTQWKEKIQQSSFVPSAGNFLDVFELNELIKDNQ